MGILRQAKQTETLKLDIYEELISILRQAIATEPANAVVYTIISRIYSSYARMDGYRGSDGFHQRELAHVYAKLAMCLAPESQMAREAMGLALDQEREAGGSETETVVPEKKIKRSHRSNHSDDKHHD